MRDRATAEANAVVARELLVTCAVMALPISTSGSILVGGDAREVLGPDWRCCRLNQLVQPERQIILRRAGFVVTRTVLDRGLREGIGLHFAPPLVRRRPPDFDLGVVPRRGLRVVLRDELDVKGLGSGLRQRGERRSPGDCRVKKIGIRVRPYWRRCASCPLRESRRRDE